MNRQTPDPVGGVVPGEILLQVRGLTKSFRIGEKEIQALTDRLIQLLEEDGEIIIQKADQSSLSETPASAKVAISASTLQAASASEMPIAAPVPSPRRRPARSGPHENANRDSRYWRD